MVAQTRRSAPPPVTLPEPLRLRSLAESKLAASNYKSALKYARRARRLDPTLPGLSVIVTALKILRCSPSDHYKILRLDPFSPPSLIRSQYKTLALSLHPDKAPSPSSSTALADAFKRVADSYHFLSDRSNKKRFDNDLRIKIASERSSEAAEAEVNDRSVETFWTACETCRILHQFDRRYVGHRLVCPSCRKSFLAAEVKVEKDDEELLVANPRATAARSRSRPGPLVPVNWGSGAKKRKVLQRPKVRKEKTLAEMQMEIVMARKNAQVKKEVSVEEVEDDEYLSAMEVEDSDFYDFDKDRTEKSFVRGQVWAVYDDDDGMPRNYGLIEEVMSLNPFLVKMCWLDVQSNRDEGSVWSEKFSNHVPCGRFKVGRRIVIDSVNFFSCLVECERAAMELYRIYPKKGSVWALYGDGHERCYEIVVFLTSYSESYGLTMAHLEKVEGYKTVFKRREIGAHAVTWLDKWDARLFSHQIPARKLSGKEDENLLGECWELDPASLPSEFFSSGCRNKRAT